MPSPHFGRASSRTRRAFLWLGAALIVAALVLALAAEYRIGLYWSPLALQSGLSALAAALALTVLTTCRRRSGPREVAVIGALAAAVSLGCSAWMRFAATRPEASVEKANAYTFFEITVLTLVLAITVRYGAAVPATGSAVLLCLAVVVRPVAVGVAEISLALALFCALGVCATLVCALVARLAALDRLRHAEQVRLEQRLTFARDLHDFVAHHVTGMVVQAQGAQIVAEVRPELTLSALGQIERAGAEAMRALRHMVSGLRMDAAPAPVDGAEGIRALVESFTLPGGGGARLTEEGPVDRLPPAAGAALHRVAMEALTNVRKHAPDSEQVTVDLQAREGTVAIDIVSGPPQQVETNATPGYGLAGLEERVTAEGGVFHAGPDSTGHWRVIARIPLESAWKDGR
ncbi:sensor histidine kinase [Streptomyces sp. TP-A0875]|uniref:sensor histidine kinase n=1 Tax=Streptomyces sp. TP-A0875 TaxID=552354 RepID=UPI0006B4E055|nr:histidine kinase [Streptomyces sp. TP-A0875]